MLFYSFSGLRSSACSSSASSHCTIWSTTVLSVVRSLASVAGCDEKTICFVLVIFVCSLAWNPWLPGGRGGGGWILPHFPPPCDWTFKLYLPLIYFWKGFEHDPALQNLLLGDYYFLVPIRELLHEYIISSGSSIFFFDFCLDIRLSPCSLLRQYLITHCFCAIHRTCLDSSLDLLLVNWSLCTD